MSKRPLHFKRFLLTVGCITAIVGLAVVEGLSYRIDGYRDSHEALNRHRLQELKAEFESGYGVAATTNDLRVFALKKTAESLHFALKYNSQTNPNEILAHGRAHCTMYAIVYSSLFNQIAKSRHWNSTCRTAYGRIHLFGVDLHQFANSRFFVNHDFCVIRNGNHVEAVDPLGFDYTGVATVRLRP